MLVKTYQCEKVVDGRPSKNVIQLYPAQNLLTRVVKLSQVL